MTSFQRIKNIVTGIFMIAFCVILMVFPNNGHVIVITLLGLSLLLSGMQYLVYYMLMARHMVGGLQMLFRGIIYMELGALAYTLMDVHRLYVLLYLIGVHGMAGLVHIMRGVEAREIEASSWKWSIAQGIGSFALSVFCIVFVRTSAVLVDVYCLGLIYSACVKIASVFRRTAI